MLTGIHKDELFKSRQYIKKDGYIDKVPFIWKTYKENSYVTAYLEDFLLWGSPETKIQGFKANINIFTKTFIFIYCILVNARASLFKIIFFNHLERSTPSLAKILFRF